MAERRIVGAPHQLNADPAAQDVTPMVVRMDLSDREVTEITYEAALEELTTGGWADSEAEEKLRAGLQCRAPDSILLIRDFRERDGVMRGGQI